MHVMSSKRRRRAVTVAAGDAPGARSEADRLLLLAARGDERAFASLYDLVAPQVFGLVRRVVRNPAVAEEVTQEVFVQVWRTCTRFDPSTAGARTWICTIAHRRAVDRVRSEEAHTRRTERYGQEAAVDPAPVTETVIDDLDRLRVRRALDVLTPVQRESVELAYYGGYTHVEVASLLGLPLGTVKTRIRDGLIRLRGSLEEEDA
jgi:RNA polymerase sigma-70 factor (ECF subfamily)